MKRINRYAVVRLPSYLNFYSSLSLIIRKNNRKIMLYEKWKKIKSTKKISIGCYSINKKIILYCPVCLNRIETKKIGSGNHRYIECSNCHSLCDSESKKAMNCYKKYIPEIYKKIYSRRLKNRENRHRLEDKHKNEKHDKYLRDIYPLITTYIINGEEKIITKISKDIYECDWIDSEERIILLQLQIPISKYKILKTIGVNLSNIYS